MSNSETMQRRGRSVRTNPSQVLPENRIIGIRKPGVVCPQCKGEYWECGACRGSGYSVPPVYIYEAFSAEAVPLFHHSNYWNTWSRILSTVGNTTIELNLTPINPRDSDAWEAQVAGIRIRKHRTPLSGETLKELPARVKEAMLGRLDSDLVLFLMRAPAREILEQIDWDKYERVNNGGANFADIRKSGVERLARAHKNTRRNPKPMQMFRLYNQGIDQDENEWFVAAESEAAAIAIIEARTGLENGGEVMWLYVESFGPTVGPPRVVRVTPPPIAAI